MTQHKKNGPRKNQVLGAVPPRVRRGSILVFVVAVLVLMVLMATAYLQMARVQRLAISDTTQSNIETVKAAVIAQISRVFVEDLFDEKGDLFSTVFAGEPADEPYDYPWTNSDSTLQENKFEVVKMDGVSVEAIGGHGDDMWLASASPDFSKEDWNHITNLNGMFLRDLGVGEWPTEDVVTNDTEDESKDTDVPLDFNDLVDADSDGVRDARWTWAST